LTKTTDPIVVADPENTAEAVISLCSTDNHHGQLRDAIVDALTKLMRHSPAGSNRFLSSLFEIGVVYNNQFILGLADTLSRGNVDKSWIGCLQVA
jgi:hypothetical protein